MPYGSTNGGSAPGGLTGGVSAKGTLGNKTFEKTKSVSYNGTQSDMIFSIASAAAATSTGGMPSTVEIENTSQVPIYCMVGYENYSGGSGGTPAGVEYFHTMLMPGEFYYPPVRGVIATGIEEAMIIGSSANNTEPSAVNNDKLFKDSTQNLAAAVDSPDTTITVTDGDFFRVGDLIQIGVDETTAKKIEIMRVTKIVTDVLTVERGLYGSIVADKDAQTDGSEGATSGSNVYFPYFNAYHDYDKYSVAQTDSSGLFKVYNFFANGRAGSGTSGMTPGSIAIKFYNSGFQNLGLSGITSSTATGISASSELKLDITVDGGTLFQDLTFTTDSSNGNFGGTNGLLSKIQSALNTQYYTAGNLFEKKVTVSIVNGDVRFTSGSRLSTSAILLADTGDSGSFIDAAANGRIPASDDIPDAVAARFPDDAIYDPVTYLASPANVFGFDDGRGNIMGICSGTINYETGAMDLRGCPPNAEFAFSSNDTSAFSGKLTESATDQENAIKDVWVNTPAQHTSGSVRIATYR